MSRVIRFADFNPSALRFDPPKKNAKGGQFVNVYLDGEHGAKRRVQIQTPPLTVPFDVSPNKDTNEVIQSYSVNLSFRGAESDPNVAGFLARMRELDELMLKTGVENSKDWWGKSSKEEVIREFHTRVVKEPKQPQYAPTMKVKVPLKEPAGPCVTQIFNETKQQEDISYIRKGSVVRMILELTPVWFIGKNMYGVSWKAVQIKVDERPGLNEYAFVDDDPVCPETACETAPLLG